MFGHSNNNNPAAVDSVMPEADIQPDHPAAKTIAPSAPAVSDNPSGDYVMTDLPHPTPSTPTVTPPPSVNPAVPSPAMSSPAMSSPAPVVHPPAQSPVSAAPGDDKDLLELKQAALTELSPLVGQLDQSPEEKFRTTMMMIQASDDQALLKEALAAAKAIPDEKTRAQALLDVVNEINYFTQQHHDGATN
jgi:hypothetical protein